MQAAKDALAQLEPPPDEIVVSTHPRAALGLAAPRRHRRDHEGAPRASPSGTSSPATTTPVELEQNVLVVANETVISKELLDRIRERAAKGPRAS